MTRRTDERSTLGPLLAELADRADRGAAEWEQRVDPRVLRRFRRQLDDAGDAMESRDVGATAVDRGKSAAAVDRARTNAAVDRARSNAAVDRARTVAAEVLVAWRLLESGCTVEYEVEVPAGRHVDFRARRDGAALCVHVKRAPQNTLRDAQVSVPAAWRTLESVERGLVVALSLARNLRGNALHRALDQAFDFVEQASVGDECSLRDAEGRPAARLRAIAPSTQRRVELVADLSSSFDDHVPRFQATLRKAFAQFMPRSENLIVVAGSSGGIDAFATALLGSQIERWDKRPRVGELIAYGRGGDGFWAGSLRNQSRLAAYWPLSAGSGPLLFVREPSARAMTAAATQLARSVFA